jgi:hypothetical protein
MMAGGSAAGAGTKVPNPRAAVQVSYHDNPRDDKPTEWQLAAAPRTAAAAAKTAPNRLSEITTPAREGSRR